MPVRIVSVKGGYRVSTPHGVKAKRTTKRKAHIQRWIIQRAMKQKGES